MTDMYLHKGNISTHNKFAGKYSFREAHNVLNPALPDIILFIHSWSGCDTTSFTFGHGKTHVIKTLLKLDSVKRLASALKIEEAIDKIDSL